jgi:DNA (cytosine-5)-methyltransferase 3A
MRNKEGVAINVLSLFDGISCGRIALERAGITVNKYYASEIDKYAQIVSEKNYPNIIRLGDVTKWKEWEIEKPDLIMGGSPCQGFSFAGKQNNFNDPRSKLFFEFVDILNHYKPKYFLLENVRMKKEYQNIISNYLDVEPIEMNSALVSAQNRKRLYWTNISNVTQLEDKKIMLRDIIQGNMHRKVTIKHPETIRRTKNYAQYDQTLKGHDSQDQRFYYLNGKSGTITRSASSIPKVEKDNEIIFLSPEEVEKLQTLPVGYTAIITNSRNRFEMIGNGWTVDIIAHIFKGIKYEK